jgi:urease accessory protein UreE
MQGLLGHLVENSPARVIATGGGNRHVKLYFENDGLITMSSSPSDSHAVENADKQIRRSLASHGIEYQTMSEIKRNKNKQKDEPAVEPE